MNNRERTLAVLNYQPYDRLPVVHFGYWPETLAKWAAEGHISKTLAARWYDNNAYDRVLCELLGFDFGWGGVFGPNLGLQPAFRRRIMARLPDGSRHVLNQDGAIVLEKDDAVSIPAEIDHLLKGRAEWERIFKPRLRYTEDRLGRAKVHLPPNPFATREGEPLLPPSPRGEGGRGVKSLRFDRGGREYLLNTTPSFPRGLWCGSLFGIIRNWLGVVGLSYLIADDPALLQEMVETVAELCYQGTAAALATGITFDYGHFWEDICFKNGPLVNPRLFARLVGPHYRRITELLNKHGVGIVSVDCDGMIDRLIPTWLENGVNTMFPIEVGTWGASIAPWRAQYGRALRGVGGMDKRVFAQDYAAIDAEIERLRPLVDLGGYIPCPDHLIPPDARWENVQYYCERMRKVFG
ncbi:MAG: uroporphyrinogen decarboxylase family protein [Anaerolineae bacterium]